MQPVAAVSSCGFLLRSLECELLPLSQRPSSRVFFDHRFGCAERGLLHTANDALPDYPHPAQMRLRWRPRSGSGLCRCSVFVPVHEVPDPGPGVIQAGKGRSAGHLRAVLQCSEQ